MLTEFWIEKGSGVSIDNATIIDANVAIVEALEMDDEHSSFWIGHIDEEYVLELHKNLNLFFIYGENQDKQLKAELRNWEQARYFIQMYFAKDFLTVIYEIELLSLSNISVKKV